MQSNLVRITILIRGSIELADLRSDQGQFIFIDLYRDTASFCSTREMPTEKFVDDFDKEVLDSGVYQRQMRSLIRRVLRRGKSAVTQTLLDH